MSSQASRHQEESEKQATISVTLHTAQVVTRCPLSNCSLLPDSVHEKSYTVSHLSDGVILIVLLGRK
jgi:hypothetical protein